MPNKVRVRFLFEDFFCLKKGLLGTVRLFFWKFLRTRAVHKVSVGLIFFDFLP